MKLTKKLLSYFLIGSLTFGSVDVPAMAADASYDASFEASDEASYEVSVASSLSSEGTGDDVSSSAAVLESAEGISDDAAVEESDIIIINDDTASEETSFDVSDGSFEASADGWLEASSEAASYETTNELPEELPDDFYTEYPTGGVIKYEPLKDVESVLVGRKRILRKAGLETSYVTPDLPALRDQNPYGACWAFATVALAEISLMKNGDMSPADLSELHLAYFTYNTETDPLGGTEGDDVYCGSNNLLNFGGRTDWALATFGRWIGAADESTANYASEAERANSSGLNSELAYADVAHVMNYYEEPIEHDADVIAANLHSNLKEMIKKYGAIGIEFYAYNSMSSSFDASIYNVSKNAYYNPRYTDDPNHAVTIVGWDDEFSKDNFITAPPGDGAFLVRNSWKTGDNTASDYSYSGYFWMSYYEKTLGEMAYAADFKLADYYDNNYEYDGGVIYDGAAISKTANIFTAHASDALYGEEIEAVSFYTFNSNVSYTAKVYTDLTDPANPESGTFAASVSGSTEYAGFHTIELTEGVTISPNSMFSVVITLEKGGQYADIGIEASFQFGDVHIEQGQSFYYSGSSWNDLYADDNGYGNFAIKAYTRNKAPEVLTGIDIVSSDIGENEDAVVGETYQFTVNPIPDRYIVTTQPVWSTTTPGNVSVDTDTGEFTVLKPGSFNVTAQLEDITESVNCRAVPAQTDYGYQINDDNTVTLWWNGTEDASYYRIFTGTRSTDVTADKGNGKYEYVDGTYVDNFDAFTATYVIGYGIGDGLYQVSLEVPLEKRYTISYVLGEGMQNSDNPAYYRQGQEKELFAPTYPDNTRVFDAWYKEATFRTKKTSITSTDKTNLTLYAKYLKALNNDTMTLTAADKVYTLAEKNYQTTFVVTDEQGKNLRAGTDYNKTPVYSYEEDCELFDGTHRAAGDIALPTDIAPVGTLMRVTVYGAGQYGGEIYGTYRIIEGDISKATVKASTLYLDGDYVALEQKYLEVKVGNTIFGTDDYEIVNAPQIFTQKGTYKVTIAGCGSYSGRKEFSVTVAEKKPAYIVFDGNGVVTGSMANIRIAGKNITLPANKFVRKGYRFTKWLGNDGIEYSIVDGSGRETANMVDVINNPGLQQSGLILYAQWEPVEYTITYHHNGVASDDHFGNARSGYNVTESFSIAVPSPAAWPVGYQFGGWYTDSAYKNRIYEVRKGTSGDLDLYAKWIPYTYTVRFDGNGATGSMTEQVFSYGVGKALSANTFKGAKGYAFVGWADTPDATYTQVQYANKEVISLNVQDVTNGVLTLYAIWSSNFEINYDLAGGEFKEGAVIPSEYAYGVKAITLPTPVRTGYTFGGWYTDNTYSIKVANIAKTAFVDYNLVAKWTPYSYTLSFNGNGSTSGKMVNQKGTFDDSIELAANAFVRKGYEFDSWNTKKDGSGDSYDDADDFYYAAVKNNDKVTLYAQWSNPLDYDVTYMDGGQVLLTDSYTFGQGLTTLLVPDDKAGFKFMGWYSDPDYKKKVTSIAKTVAGDMTLYARYDMTQNYVIKFNPNCVSYTGTMNDQSVKYITSTALTRNKFVNTNENPVYGFAGWSTDPDSGVVLYTDGEKLLRPDVDLMDEEDGKFTLTLYAVWKDSFDIIYDPNGGDMPAGDYVTEYGVGVVIKADELPVPAKDGYTFAGWFLDSKLTKKANGIIAGSLGDKTLYAKWTGKKYFVDYKSDMAADNRAVTGRMSKQTYTHGTAKAINKNSYKIKGYEFKGWTTVSYEDRVQAAATVLGRTNDAEFRDYYDRNLAADDVQLLPGDKVDHIGDQFSENVSLYAVWEKLVYQITYENVTAAESTGFKTEYTVDDAYALPEPERLGYTHMGWHLDKKLAKKAANIKVGSTGNLVLYAKWTPMHYTIRYDLNEGVNSIYPATLITDNAGYISSYNLSYDSGYRLATATRENYTFGGWYKEAATRTKVGSIIASPTVDMTVYAKWIPISVSYTVHFDANGSDTDKVTGTMKDIKGLKFGTGYKLTKSSFKRSNYTFAGWNTMANGTGISFTDAQAFRDLCTTDGEVVTLYAQWSPVTYSIKYNLNGGKLDADAITSYTYGQEITLPVPVKSFYSFVGWYTDAAFTESRKITSVGGTTGGNITIYAKYQLDVTQELIRPDEYLDVTDFGAVPSDGNSDRSAIQAAVQQAGLNYHSGGVTAIYFPAGVYDLCPNGQYDMCIGMWSGIQLFLDDNAVLKVSPNSYTEYGVLGVKNVDDVIICGGQIDGGRYDMPTKKGEWGHGVAIYGSRNVLVANMEVYGNWGDGVYLGTQAVRQPDNSQRYMGCENVIVSNCEIYDNRRNGISLTDADDTYVIGCNIYDSHGTAPQCGIYIEPNSDSSDKVCERLTVENTVITAYQNRNDAEHMCFMTHYNPYNPGYVTARDVKFIGCVINGYFGNYSGVKMTYTNTAFKGTVVNLKS